MFCVSPCCITHVSYWVIPAPHQGNSKVYASVLFNFLFLELCKSAKQPNQLPSNENANINQDVLWSQRFILERVLAGLDLPEPVDLQAKARRDSSGLDARGAAMQTVSTPRPRISPKAYMQHV